MEEKKAMALLVPVMAFGLLVTTFSASQIDDITCGEARSLLLPCLPYLEGSGPGEPPPACCEGATSVYQRANTTQVRREICVCLKNAAKDMPINQDRAKRLPEQCKLNVPFPLDPNVNCST